MGSLRRGVMLALLPSTALADVCSNTRPGWDGVPVSLVQEAIFLFSTPFSLALILASLLAIRFRHQWGALVVVVLWTIVVTMVTMADPTGVRDVAISEGCVGSPTLFIGIVAAICVGMMLYTSPGKAPDSNPD